MLGELAYQLEGKTLERALDAAAAITDEPAHAQALGALADRLERKPRRTVLAQALDAATAITDESTRAQVLGELADQLEGELLKRAWDAVPHENKATRIALLTRAATVLELRTGYLPLFRAATRFTDRPTALTLITTCFTQLTRLGDTSLPKDTLAAIRDILRWWR